VSGKHGDFVRQRSNHDSSGEIVTTEGKVVGKHTGIESFTIGQRKGLGVAMHEPYFVTEIDREHYRIVIGRKESLQRTRLFAKDDNWLADIDFNKPIAASVQIRYNSSPESAMVVRHQNSQFDVTFDQPIEGIAPGQLAVVFQDERVLGGGWIDRAE
jgi:tRNA-specific 2-thiouridylase